MKFIDSFANHTMKAQEKFPTLTYNEHQRDQILNDRDNAHVKERILKDEKRHLSEVRQRKKDLMKLKYFHEMQKKD